MGINNHHLSAGTPEQIVGVFYPVTIPLPTAQTTTNGVRTTQNLGLAKNIIFKTLVPICDLKHKTFILAY